MTTSRPLSERPGLLGLSAGKGVIAIISVQAVIGLTEALLLLRAHSFADNDR